MTKLLMFQYEISNKLARNVRTTLGI